MSQLVIPCKLAPGPDPVAPIYLGNGWYKCPFCKKDYYTTHPTMLIHMGMVENKKPTCSKLLEDDEKRRERLRNKVLNR